MQQSPRQPRPLLFAALALAAGGAACDGSKLGRDASTPLSERVSEVSVRMDLTSAGTAPSVSVLAFQATVTGAPAADVLGVVDPLIAGTPGSTCQRRDVTSAPGALGALGGRVDLDALPGLAIELGGPAGADVDAKVALRPAARVFPEIASVVAGVVSESAPVDIAAVPGSVAVLGPDGANGANLANVGNVANVANLDRGGARSGALDIPGGPLLLGDDDQPLAANAVIDPSKDLVLRLQTREPGKTILELRPLYTTTAIACPVDPQTGRVVVPASDLAQLVRSTAHTPVSVEAVWRDSRPLVLSGRTARLSVEVHSSAVVSLRR